MQSSLSSETDPALNHHHHHHKGEDDGVDSSPSASGDHHHREAVIRRQVSSIDMPIVKTGIFGASSNLMNAIVGAGIIGIPYALRESGLIIGVVLLIIVSIFTDKSLRMIIELARYHPDLKLLGVHTFEDLMSIPFGRAGMRFILASMLIMAYGAMVAYLLIIKDTVPTLLGLGHSFLEREVVMTITSTVIMVPLSMLRDISQLAITSSLSVIADLLLVLVVCLYSPIQSSVQDAGGFGTVLKDNWINGHLFIGLGVLSTAMACQHSSFLIAGTLERPTPDRWAIVTGRSLVVASLASLILGIAGYLGYLDNTQGDVLNNFDPQSHAINAGRALLAITMFFTYPMESFVARHVVVQLFFAGNMDNSTTGPDGQSVAEQKRCCGLLGRREIITIALYVTALAPALIVDDLGPVLSLTGSLGASALAYMAPGLVYLGVNGTDFLLWVENNLHHRSSKNMTIKTGHHDGSGGEVELPVMGDATATMQTAASSQQRPLRLPGQGIPTRSSFSDYSKPWWWFLIGMPIWVAIADSGGRGTHHFLSEMGLERGEVLTEVELDESGRTAGLTIGPRKRDYIWSILFIIFGVIAAVVGVASNIYVQVHDIFFIPT